MSVQSSAPRVVLSSYRLQFVIQRALLYLVLTIGAVAAIFPLYWMISSSLKESFEILQHPPTLWPHNWTTAHYEMVLRTVGLERAFLNSLIVSTCRVYLVSIIAAMTGYSLAKLRFPGRNVLFMIVLGLMMVPMHLYLIPLFLLIEQYRLIDTYLGLIMPGAVNSFSIFLMRQAFLSVPNDYIDAAIVDGAGHIHILFKIAFPMVTPMALTLALVNAFWTWNDFLWPFIVIVREEMSTLPVALARFSRIIIGVGGTTRAGPVMAAATLTALPIVVIFLIFQRHFVEALTMAGLKG